MTAETPARADPSRPSQAPSPADVTAALRAAGCVFAEDEARLLIDAATSPEELVRLVAERLTGAPLEHILGWAEFGGLRIGVGPGVFVPRRRTELLAVEACRLARAGSVVVDLCCGSGAVGAVIAATVEGVDLHAADIEEAAVRCARRNLGPGGHVHQGDLYDALPSALRGRVDILAVNAPYVPTDEIDFMPPEARTHEPHAALDGGPDGLDVQRRLVAAAPRWLSSGGHVLIETSAHQADATQRLLADAGLSVRVVRSEELDATVVVGRWDGSRNAASQADGEAAGPAASCRSVVGQAVAISGGSSRSREPRDAV